MRLMIPDGSGRKVGEIPTPMRTLIPRYGNRRRTSWAFPSRFVPRQDTLTTSPPRLPFRFQVLLCIYDLDPNTSPKAPLLIRRKDLFRRRAASAKRQPHLLKSDLLLLHYLATILSSRSDLDS